MRSYSLIVLLLWSLSLQAAPLDDLHPVGAATLKVLFFTIYDSRLYTPDGDYDGVEPDLALHIIYRRDIAAADLIDRTRKEWQKLSVYEARSEEWLERLASLWPYIEEGDALTLRVDEELASRFYFNDEFIGVLADSAFTRDFLAIWLSEESSYARLRDQLIGIRQ